MYIYIVYIIYIFSSQYKMPLPSIHSTDSLLSLLKTEL